MRIMKVNTRRIAFGILILFLGLLSFISSINRALDLAPILGWTRALTKGPLRFDCILLFWGSFLTIQGFFPRFLKISEKGLEDHSLEITKQLLKTYKISFIAKISAFLTILFSSMMFIILNYSNVSQSFIIPTFINSLFSYILFIVCSLFVSRIYLTDINLRRKIYGLIIILAYVSHLLGLWSRMVGLFYGGSITFLILFFPKLLGWLFPSFSFYTPAQLIFMGALHFVLLFLILGTKKIASFLDFVLVLSFLFFLPILAFASSLASVFSNY